MPLWRQQSIGIESPDESRLIAREFDEMRRPRPAEGQRVVRARVRGLGVRLAVEELVLFCRRAAGPDRTGELGTESIDILQFHVWDDSWANEPEFRETVEKLKSDKLIRFFGLSLNRWQPANGIAALRTGLVDTVQVIYNIFDQSPEDKLFPVCRQLNVGVIARVPLDEGSLGGKMTRETKFPSNDWRAKYFGPANLAQTVARVDELKKILPAGMSLPEMSLQFILSNPDVGTTIIGMRKLAHVKENIAVSDAGPLDKALLQKLKAHRWDRVPQDWSD